MREDAPDDLVHAEVMALRRRLGAQILGQQTLVDRLLAALLAGGHLLVEG
ncbi:MAG: AAA family ATPase, partial [Thiohalocapsa sp.]